MGGPLADNDGGKKGDAPLPGQKVGVSVILGP